jgi:hypothetical protein
MNYILPSKSKQIQQVFSPQNRNENQVNLQIQNLISKSARAGETKRTQSLKRTLN